MYEDTVSEDPTVSKVFSAVENPTKQVAITQSKVNENRRGN